VNQFDTCQIARACRLAVTTVQGHCELELGFGNVGCDSAALFETADDTLEHEDGCADFASRERN